MIRGIFALLVLCGGYASVFGQEPGPEPLHEPEKRSITTPGLFGKIVDSKTNKGIEAASVQVFVSTPKGDSLIAGMLTLPNGDFAFPNLALSEGVTVMSTALGYSDNIQPVKLPAGYSPKHTIDLGNIKLSFESEELGSVTIVAQRPTMQMGIDRRIFNVDKSLTSTGGTAADVMRNIPTLTVDAEGNVQMRNASPQLFVDGRPTILTLDQIPADDIERVEIITNPSAKYDAASSGGILNVILKKNKRLGLNGIASIGAGAPGVLTGSASINLRKDKFNFFATGNFNKQGGTARTEAWRQNKENGIITDYFNQQSETDRGRRFTNIRFGVDYFLDNRNTISVSQNFVKGRFTSLENQEQQYLDAQQVVTRLGDRVSDNLGRFDRSVTQLNYTHNFPKHGMELTADLTYSSGDGGGRSYITNRFFQPSGSQIGDPYYVNNRSSNSNKNFTAQVDFVNPLTENSKIEMGLRTFRKDNSNDFNSFAVENAVEVKLPLSNKVKYDESIHAAYVTYSNKVGTFGYQVGLRGEYTKFNGEMVDSAQSFGYTFPKDLGGLFDGLFPSLYLTKEIAEGQELQLNFSRRIRRPDFWQMSPNIDINDPLNISQGNPQIRPEYTNSFEFNYNNQYDKGNFLASLYFRNNVGDITRYSDTISSEQYEQLNNAAISPNAILNTFINAQFTNRMGAEFTVTHRFGNLELIPNLNLQYRRVKASFKDFNLSNEGFNWNTKLIVNYKINSTQPLWNNFNFQLTTQYASRQVIPQGKNKERYSTDIAIRKEFLKNKAGTLTLAVNDVFNTNRFGMIYDTEDFYQDFYRRWDIRNFRVTFSYRFGSRDINFFGKEKKNNRDEEI